MTDIALTLAVRQGLNAILTTQAAQADTSVRLATGREVNTALDDPIRFFTSRSVGSRARALVGTLDRLELQRGTLQAAMNGGDKGLELLGLARAQLEDAKRRLDELPAAFTTSAVGRSGLDRSFVVDNDAQMPSTGRVSNSEELAISLGPGNTARYRHGNPNYGPGTSRPTDPAYSTRDGETVGHMLDAINANTFGLSAFLDGNGAVRFKTEDDRGLFFYSDHRDVMQAFDLDRGALWSGVGDADRTVTGWRTLMPLNTRLRDIPDGSRAGVTLPAGGITTLTLGDGTNTFNFNRGNNTIQDFMDAMNTANDNGNFNYRARVVGGKMELYSTAATDRLTVAQRSFAWAGLDVDTSDPSGQNVPTLSRAIPDVPNKFYDQYIQTIDQYDALVGDSHVEAKTLLEGERETAVLNEKGLKTTLRAGQDIRTHELGLRDQAYYDFFTPEGLDKALARIVAAEAEAKVSLNALSSQLAVLDARLSFNKDMVNVLQSGAERMVLADPQAEGARMLASNTRLQLASNALSLATQADRAVLRLF